MIKRNPALIYSEQHKEANHRPYSSIQSAILARSLVAELLVAASEVQENSNDS
jgi:hypothetical protein